MRWPQLLDVVSSTRATVRELVGAVVRTPPVGPSPACRLRHGGNFLHAPAQARGQHPGDDESDRHGDGEGHERQVANRGQLRVDLGERQRDPHVADDRMAARAATYSMSVLTVVLNRWLTPSPVVPRAR